MTERFILDVKHDIKKAERFLTDVQKKAVPRAAARSLNRAGTKGKSVATRKIARKIHLKQKLVRRHIALTARATHTRLYVIVTATGKPFNIIEFVSTSKRKVGAFRKKKGVYANPYGRRRLYKGAFIASGKNSNKLLVFIRKNPKDWKSKIKSVAGPSAPKTMIQKEIVSAMRLESGAVWAKEFPRNLKYYLSRIK